MTLAAGPMKEHMFICGSAPDECVAVAGGERVEKHVQGEEHALQAAQSSGVEIRGVLVKTCRERHMLEITIRF